MKKQFEGWYFKHQLKSNMVAFIPGKSEKGTFIQMLLPDGAHFYETHGLSVKDNEIRTENCIFSLRGCEIDLPGVQGKIEYGEITPLHSNIMGPFRFFPMECRHSVISMSHSLSGSLSVDGKKYIFNGGTGYIEKDSGVSFPSSYQWIQCNDFTEPCSVMVSIARIPFGPVHFTGCICAIIYRGREYRFATYNGVHIDIADETHMHLSQRDLELNIEIHPLNQGLPLKSPISGLMNGTVRERTNAEIHIRLTECNQPVFDLHSQYATYEYVAENSQHPCD